MLAEALIVTAAYALGWAFLRPVARDLGLIVHAIAAYPLGISLWVLVAAVWLIAGIPFHPLGITLLAAGLVAALHGRWGTPLARNESMAIAIGGIGAAALAATAAHMEWTFFTSDSLMILAVADQIISDRGLSASLRASIASFPLHLSLAFTPAVWLDAHYLKSLPPLFGVAAVALLAVLGLRAAGVAAGLPRARAIIFPAVAAATLASMPLFLWAATYVNGHVVFATLFLMACGGIYFAAIERSPSWWVLGVTAAACLVPVRMEAGLSMLPLLVVAATVRAVALPLRLVAVGSIGLATGGWYAFLIVKSFGHGLVGVYELFVIGAAPGFFGVLLLATALVQRRIGRERIERLLAGLPQAMIGTLVLIVLGHGAADLAALPRALHAFAVFATEARFGAAGYTLAIGLLVVAAPLVAPRHDPARLILLPLIGYLLVILTIALRTPWQNADISDSTNRMLVHVIPAFLFYILARYSGGRSPG